MRALLYLLIPLLGGCAECGSYAKAMDCEKKGGGYASGQCYPPLQPIKEK